MRKRKYLIGAAATLALTVSVAALAHAGTLTSQTVSAVVNGTKQDKKKAGPMANFTISVDTQYSDNTIPFTGKANNTKVDFPKDWTFFTTGLAQCDPNAPGFSTSTTEVARQMCGPSEVGTGKATLQGPVPNVAAVVTAFNATPGPGGEPRVILHSRTGPPLNSTAPLIGTLRTGPGGPYGRTLDVVVPILPGGFVITHFETTIPKKVVKKANKKKGKPAKYYVSAKCSKKTWQFQARSTYDTGATTTDTHNVACKQKKAKKKK